MPTITLTHTIHRSAAEVFAAAADARSYPAWNPTMKSVRQITPGPLAEGTRFQTTAAGFGDFVMTISEYAPPRRVKMVSKTKMADMYHLFVLTPQGDSTSVQHIVTVQPQGLWRIMAPVIALTLRRNITTATNALKAHVESQGAAAAAPISR